MTYFRERADSGANAETGEEGKGKSAGAAVPAFIFCRYPSTIAQNYQIIYTHFQRHKGKKE
jgi:hypothetical protein